MDKSIKISCQLVLIGIICLTAVFPETNAVHQKHKKQKKNNHLTLEYNWPDPNPNIDHFPHESSCHYYYLWLSEEDVELKRCPDGELFDYVLHKCNRKEHTRCWSRHFGKLKHRHVPSKHRDVLRCPYEWGKYPVLYDCKKYYACVNNVAKLKKCAPFEKFDKILRKCVAEIDAVCADETDHVEHGYKCPRGWGFFSFLKDCSKYYECLYKTPNVRTCPVGELFDEKQSKCLPKLQVKCDKRPNPYAITTSSNPPADSPTSQPPKQSSIDLVSIERDNNKELPEKDFTVLSDTTQSSNKFPEVKPVTQSEQASFPEKKQTDKTKLIASGSSPTSSDLLKEQPLNDNSTATPEEKSISRSLTVTLSEKDSMGSYNVGTGETLLSNEDHVSGVNFSEKVEPGSTSKPSAVASDKSSVANGNSSMEVTNKPKEAIKRSSIAAADTTGKQPESLSSRLSLRGDSGEFIEDPAITKIDEDTISTSVTAQEKNISAAAKSLVIVKEPIAGKTVDETSPSAEPDEPKKRVEVLENSTPNEQSVKESVADVKVDKVLVSTLPSSLPVYKKKVADNIESPNSPKPMEDPKNSCSPEDTTCIKDKDGTITRCPAQNGLFPFPKDEKKFIMCEGNVIRIPECPQGLLFDPDQKKCLWKAILF